MQMGVNNSEVETRVFFWLLDGGGGVLQLHVIFSQQWLCLEGFSTLP